MSDNFVSEAGNIFKKEPKLIELPKYGRAVFVGDTHGDLNATERVVNKYTNGDTVIVFLGDYVDRGPYSKENIDYLLNLKCEKPKNLILLMGNHEGFRCGTGFWDYHSHDDIELYEGTLIKLPLAVSGNGIIGVHGALPDVQKIEDINKIKPSNEDERFLVTVWGDWQEKEGEILGSDLGRPQFGKGYFEDKMKKFGKNVLIRSHDPSAKEIMYDKRCLTIFTSKYYPRERKVAIADLGKEVKTVDDLEIEEI